MNNHTFPKCFALVLLLLTASLGLNAAPRPLEQARAAAKQLLSRHTALKAPGHSGTAAEPRLIDQAGRSAKEAYYYVFAAGTGEGYAIISGDDRMPTVVGYTTSGTYDADNLPPALVDFLADYRATVSNVTGSVGSQANAAGSGVASRAAVAPFVKTRWGQGTPYNSVCPEYAGGKRAVTGCSATAMAQVLAYYRTPDRLLATIPAYTSEKNDIKIDMPAIPAGEAYDWANILDAYKEVEATTEQKTAVAKLMLHVGCAMEMKYGSSSAATVTADQLTRYFGMDAETTRKLQRSAYQQPEWDAILYEEMAARRPVLYTGSTTGSGHAFVIHGYEDGLYYVNWGWGGNDDGYFDITVLNPKDTSGEGASTTKDGYSRLNYMIVGIQPDNGITDTSLPSPALTSRLFGKEQIQGLAFDGKRVTATVSGWKSRNKTPIDLTRTLSIGYRDAQGRIVKVANEVTKKASSGKTQSMKEGEELHVDFAAEDNHTYELFLIEKSATEEWLRCPVETSALDKDAEGKSVVPHCTVAVRISAGTPSLLYLASSLTATLKSVTPQLATMPNTIEVTLTNTAVTEYYKSVYVRLSQSETMPDTDDYGQGMAIPAGESRTFDFAYTPEEAGEYNVWVLNSSHKEIYKGKITFAEAEPPQLAFVSIRCPNASANTVFATYKGEQVQMSTVADTKAEIEFTVRNDGGYYVGDFYYYTYKADQGAWSGSTYTLTLPPGSTTTHAHTVSGNAGDVVGVALVCKNKEYKIRPLSPALSHTRQTASSAPLNLTDREIVCLVGTSTALNGVTTATSPAAPYYNLGGQRVNATAKGIVIQNGRKTVRR